jgi:geranylgeranyl diphosphate synthase type II
MPSSSVELQNLMSGLRERVNARLAQYLELDCPERLREGMAYSLLAGGKRLRPLLVLLAAEASGGAIEAAMPAACAIEMVHTYSLIHDDLPAMDDDDLRRGKPTNHVAFGEANAILAGDALLTLAFEVLARDTRPPEAAAACCTDLARAAGAAGMVGGQAADLAAEQDGDPTLEQLEGIHRLKTGALLSCALIMGGRVAQARHETLRALETYGKSVGLAFQIADDLLDLTGEPARMGKAVRKDADHHKLTYPSLLGVEESRARARALIDDACRAVSVLGSRGQRLESLARFVLERDH